MKYIFNLKRINNLHDLITLLGEDVYNIFADITPLDIFLDTKDGTFSVRGAWDADDLTLLQLKDGLLAFGESEVE